MLKNADLIRKAIISPLNWNLLVANNIKMKAIIFFLYQDLLAGKIMKSIMGPMTQDYLLAENKIQIMSIHGYVGV